MWQREDVEDVSVPGADGGHCRRMVQMRVEAVMQWVRLRRQARRDCGEIRRSKRLRPLEVATRGLKIVGRQFA